MEKKKRAISRKHSRRRKHMHRKPKTPQPPQPAPALSEALGLVRSILGRARIVLSRGRQAIGKTGLVIKWLALFAGQAAAIWWLIAFVQSLYLIQPMVTRSGEDKNEPFSMPFLITNSHWAKMHALSAQCFVAEMRISNFQGVGPVILRGAYIDPVQYPMGLEYQEGVTFPCRFAGQGRSFVINPTDVFYADVRIDTEFELRLIPLFPWHKTSSTAFTMVRDSNNEAHWIQGATIQLLNRGEKVIFTPMRN
jgi:hypothetical protein